MNTARDTIFAFSAQIATFAISILSSVLIARFLGPDGKGVLAVLLRVAGATQAFSQWGIQETLLPYMRENRNSSKSLSGSALALGGVFACGASVLMVLAYPAMADSVLKGVSLEHLVGVMLSVPLTVLGLFLGRIVQLRSTRQYNVGQVAAALLSIGGYALAFWLWRSNVVAGIAGFLASQAISFGVYLFLGLRMRLIGLSIKRAVVRKLLGSGSAMQIGLMASFLATQVGALVLNAYTNSSEVGLFATAIGLGNLLLFFSVSVRLVLQNRMAETDSSEDLAGLTARMARHTLLWLVMGAIGLSIVGRMIIVILYGKAFAGAYLMLLWAMPGFVALGVAQILASYFVAVKRLLFTSIAAIAAVAINLTIMFALGSQLSGITAAIAQSLSSIVWLAIYAIWFSRLTRERILHLIPAKAELKYYVTLVRRALPQP